MIGALVGIVFGLSLIRQCDNIDVTESDMFHPLAVFFLDTGVICCCCKYAPSNISRNTTMIIFIELYHIQCDKMPAKKGQPA